MRILTPRGVTLAGTLVSSADSVDVVVLFPHSLLVDRHSAGHFDRPARQYRATGYAALEFDYLGYGQSGDETITLDAEVEDLRAASGQLADQGYSRQITHARSFGASVALTARPGAVLIYILSSPRIGPMSVDWRQTLSEGQLAGLEQIGATTVPGGSAPMRRQFMISEQTLANLSMGGANKFPVGLDRPALIIHDATDTEFDLLEMAQEVFPFSPNGFHAEVTQDVFFGESINTKALDAPSPERMRRWMPIVRRR